MKGKSLLLGSILGLLLCAVPITLRAQNSGFVYISNTPPGQPHSILGYSITDDSGALTPLSGSPFPSTSGSGALAVTPSGKFLYTPSNIPGAYGQWGVAGYAIDANSGSLTPLPGSPFFTENTDIGPDILVMAPSGGFLYVADMYYGQVFVYSIDQNTGALTLQSSSPSGAQYAYPAFFGLDATGQYAYFTYWPFRSSAPNGAVSAFKIDQATGSFTLVPGSPFIVPRDPTVTSRTPPTPNWAVSDPSSRFLYVADTTQLDLWTFSIDPASGALTLLPSSPMHIRHGTNQFTIDPGGNLAYFTTSFPNPAECGNYYPFTSVEAPNALYVYNIDQTSGALSPAKTPVINAGYEPDPVRTDPSGTFVYALNLQGYNFDANSSTISAYRAHGIGGPLTEVLGSPFSAGAHAALNGLAVAASQK